MIRRSSTPLRSIESGPLRTSRGTCGERDCFSLSTFSWVTRGLPGHVRGVQLRQDSNLLLDVIDFIFCILEVDDLDAWT